MEPLQRELNYRILCFWSEEDQEFVATCVQLPGLSGLGATEQEALTELLTAMSVWFEHQEPQGGLCLLGQPSPLAVSTAPLNLFFQRENTSVWLGCSAYDEHREGARMGGLFDVNGQSQETTGLFVATHHGGHADWYGCRKPSFTQPSGWVGHGLTGVCTIGTAGLTDQFRPTVVREIGLAGDEKPAERPGISNRRPLAA